MNPQDDPEARIRALEQPLSDMARASELGTDQQYSADGYTPTSAAHRTMVVSQRVSVRVSHCTTTFRVSPVDVDPAGHDQHPRPRRRHRHMGDTPERHDDPNLSGGISGGAAA